MISSLMKLFRGRKYNIIRKRDDSNTYEVTELYIGVMVFSISIFLIPTIAVFYFYCFISTILSVMMLQLLLISM